MCKDIHNYCNVIKLYRVAHLAGKLVEKLRDQQEGQEGPHIIDSKDVLCVKIAALCHDLGEAACS